MSPVSGISALLRQPASRPRDIESSRSTRTSPSSQVSRQAVLPVDEPGVAELVRRTTRDRIAPLSPTNASRRCATRTSSGSRTTLRSMRTIAQTSSTCCAGAGPRSRSRPERRHPRLVAAPGRVDPTARAVEPAGPTFAYSPENLRLGDAIAAFTQPDRIVVGIRPESDRSRIEELLSAFSDRIEWMDVESAELVKHGRERLPGDVDRVCERACGHCRAGRR